MANQFGMDKVQAIYACMKSAGRTGGSFVNWGSIGRRWLGHPLGPLIHGTTRTQAGNSTRNNSSEKKK